LLCPAGVEVVMWSPHVGFALAGIVILSVGVAAPAQSATDDHIDDKQLEIQRMQHYVPTPEEVAETAAMLAEEQHRIAVPAISPGYAIPGDGDVVLRVYPGVNIDAVEKALEGRGLVASVLPSRYWPAEVEALDAALAGIHLESNEAFGFAYDAIKDVVSVNGNVQASKVHAAVGDQLPYEFEYGEEAGRTGRSTQPSADTR
jgi:superfamily I DNA/RNA helicase